MATWSIESNPVERIGRGNNHRRKGYVSGWYVSGTYVSGLGVARIYRHLQASTNASNIYGCNRASQLQKPAQNSLLTEVFQKTSARSLLYL